MAKHFLKIGTMTMPYTSKINYTGATVGNETKMASGALVMDVVGFRPTLTYTYDWLPDDTMQALHALMRQNRYHVCTYITPEGMEVTASCRMDYPACDYFTYRNGKAIWHNAVITLARREVVTV